MTKKLKVGDHVTWNSEAGHVSGMIIKKHTKDIAYKGYTHHASELEPQYEIKSDKSGHNDRHLGEATLGAVAVHVSLRFVLHCDRRRAGGRNYVNDCNHTKLRTRDCRDLAAPSSSCRRARQSTM